MGSKSKKPIQAKTKNINTLTPSDNNPNPKLKSSWIKRLFYLAFLVIPVLFFILLEASLRYFNYGTEYPQWVTIAKTNWMLNPDIARRYFYNTKDVPNSNEDLFDIVKAPNSFRVFVLGESSAAGYPSLPLGSFPRYLEKRLQVLYPDRKIEVVNVSMTAINTFALRDMFPEILNQKPDLVLVYTGHNEFYGALGAGSVESLGSSTKLVNLMLYLNRYRTVQLLRNTIKGIAGLFSSGKPRTSGTLMARVVKDQYISYGGDKYNQGLEQFKNNMTDILSMAKENGVPVILGTLTSNLKDQTPFISRKESGKNGAKEIFEQAKKELAIGNKSLAKELFIKAKDNDLLRFRASEDLNEIIRKLGKQFSNPIVEVDSAFNAYSPDGIVGNNLMTDHLHPTLEGYQLMERLFFNKMKETGNLPQGKSIVIAGEELNNTVIALNKSTRLDTLLADIRIKVLKNDWPYIDKKNSKPVNSLFELNDYIDSLAADVVLKNIPWEKAHRSAAQWYLNRRDYENFKNYMDVLIDQYPVIIEYYNFTANVFIEQQDYETAYLYLSKGYNIKPTAYFAKWLGIIDLSKGKNDTALKYLSEGVDMYGEDPQALFNLSGAYIYKKDYRKALEIINKCLKVSPNFPDAQSTKAQLVQVVNNNNVQ